MKNITLSADEDLIEAARRRALAERITLNAQYRLWLQSYVGREQQADVGLAAIHKLSGEIRTGGQTFTWH